VNLGRGPRAPAEEDVDTVTPYSLRWFRTQFTVRCTMILHRRPMMTSTFA